MSDPIEKKPSSKRRVGLLLIGFLLAGFIAFVAYSSKQLPDRVATHFDLHGKPNGWMTRSQHVNFTIAIGGGTTVLIVGVFALVGKMRGWGLNMPNKEYWLAPEREQATFEYLQSHSLWLAILVIAFHAGMFQAFVIANSQKPAFLPTSHMAWLGGGFIFFIAIWIIAMLRRFRLPTTP